MTNPTYCDEFGLQTVDMTRYSTLDQLVREMNETAPEGVTIDRVTVFALAKYVAVTMMEACNPDFEEQLKTGSASPSIWVLDGPEVHTLLGDFVNLSADEIKCLADSYPALRPDGTHHGPRDTCTDAPWAA